jgi:adenylate cyclase
LKSLKITVPKKKLRQKSRKRLFHALILLGVGSIFTLIIALVQPFYTFNLWFADQFLETDSPSPNIVIAGIDDTSLETFGKWSEWPRSLHTSAIENLKQAGAAVIGYDVIFADDSPDDAGLAAAINQADNVVLAVAGTDRISVKDKELTLKEFLLPAEQLRENTSSLGHVNIVPDPDGKVRRIPLIATGENGETYPSLGVAMLHVLFHLPLLEDYTANNGKITLLMRDIPVDESYFMRLNYAVTDNTLTYISYKDIVKNNFDPALVKNKIVLVGIMATGDLDAWSVPTAAIRIPGVLIHAAVMDTILRTQFVTEAGMSISLLIMMLVVFICTLLFPWVGTWKWQDMLKVTGITVALLFLYVFACALISNSGLILNVLYPSLTLLVLYISNIIYMVLKEQNDKKFVKELFGRYVSPQISKEIVAMANEGGLKLGGEEREVTIFFCDIRNFTTISEKLSPEGVVKMLNTCLPIMIDAVVRNEGFVNKFAGDNLMGVWNTPKSQDGHAKLAVKAAWEAQQKMRELCGNNLEIGNVQFGIGINTGKAVAGNVGSSGRVEYTVIGDAVNLASRICSVAPGTEILIGPETYHQAQDSIEVEPLPPQMFKGKSQLIVVYRVKGLRNPI